ncbi:MAG: sigma-70 family RNA polymerase sigma factor [Clostridia bacterium]|nr:sigma-70 family RNA polymerase sigma factor [Clostridia bacterium]
MDHKNIIKLLFDRDESALAQIQRQYGNLIKSIAFNLLKSDSVAEECLNDTLMDIWNTIPPENPPSIASYACMLVRRRTIDRVRYENAQKRARPEGSEYTEACEELLLLDDISEEIVDRLDLSRMINEFLGDLSRTNREIFISRYYDFESLDSIAVRLHLSRSSVGTRLFRMKNSLKEKLEKEGVTV